MVRCSEVGIVALCSCSCGVIECSVVWGGVGWCCVVRDVVLCIWLEL